MIGRSRALGRVATSRIDRAVPQAAAHPSWDPLGEDLRHRNPNHRDSLPVVVHTTRYSLRKKKQIWFPYQYLTVRLILKNIKKIKQTSYA
jgi:hypothetical protein